MVKFLFDVQYDDASLYYIYIYTYIDNDPKTIGGILNGLINLVAVVLLYYYWLWLMTSSDNDEQQHHTYSPIALRMFFKDIHIRGNCLKCY
jgi:NhaP-type Na+/H+ or K+/H+ antiporter